MNTSANFEKLKKQYLKLISDPLVGEEVIHRFFIKYPIFLPLFRPYDNIVFSKFPLANQYVVDFAFAREDSQGVHWGFIEIEKPHSKQVTRNGNQTRELTHGLNQIYKWGEWFDNNRAFAEKKLPFKEKVAKIGITQPKLLLVIGRREFAFNRSFLKPGIYNDINIMSYDRLVDNITSPAVDLFQPLKVCSLVNDKIKIISEYKIDYDL